MPTPEKSEHKKALQTAQRALQAVRDAEAAARAAVPTPDATWRGWSIALGIPAAVIGAGFAVLGFHFILGIFIGCVGSILLLLTSLYFSRKQSGAYRFVVSLVSFAFLGLFAWLWFRPASIEVTAISMSDGYESGTIIAGIKWDEVYSEARLIIENKSDSVYTEINAYVRTDLLITKIGSMNPNSHCQSAPLMPFQITGATLGIVGKDKETPERALPLFTPESEGVRASQFKLHCDKLLPGEIIEAVVALVSSKERVPPKWISAEVEYDAFGRTRSALPLKRCFAEKCDPIPGVREIKSP
jgi:hypothetical protein